MKLNDHPQTRNEERVNSITHAGGLLLSIIGLVALLYRSVGFDEFSHLVAVSIFGGSLIVLYTASTLYHSFDKPHVKLKLRVFDHSAIYVLIAGTYMPFLFVNLKHSGGLTFAVIMGLMAAGGIIFKLFFTGRFETLSTALYVFMAWLFIFFYGPAIEHIQTGGLILISVGGFFYMSGLVFYKWHKLPFSHCIWHIFVLLGSISHYFAVFFYANPI
jgi:hemolysin III